MNKMLKKSLILLALVVILAVVGFRTRSHDSSESIKLGYIGALSGVGAAVGEEEMKAVTLAAEVVNERGGINGRKLEIVFGDVSIDKMKEAGSVTRKLIDVDKVVGIVGPQWDEPAAAILPIIKESKIPTIGVNTTKDLEANIPNEFFFSTWYDNEEGIKELLRFAKTKGWSKVAIIRPFAGGFWELTRNYFIKHAAAYGVEVVAEENVGNFLELDYRTYLSKVKLAGPEAIFLVVSDYNQCTILKQMKELGLAIPLLSTESAGDQVSLRNCPELLTNVYFSSPTKSAKYPEFEGAFVAKYGAAPAFPSAVTAYDAVFVFAKALSSTNGEGGEKLRDVLTHTQIKGFSQEDVIFDQNGFVLTKPGTFGMQTTKSGKFVQIQ